MIEKAPSNYAAYVPDLPGCIVTGATVTETESLIRETIEFHAGLMNPALVKCTSEERGAGGLLVAYS